MKTILSVSVSVCRFTVYTPRFALGGKRRTAPSDKINLGLIGTGRKGISLVRSFLNTGGVRILAACDVYKANLDHFVSDIKIPT